MNQNQIINDLSTGIALLFCLSPLALGGVLLYVLARRWRGREQASDLPTSGAADEQPAFQTDALPADSPPAAPIPQLAIVEMASPATPLKPARVIRPVTLSRQQKAAVIRQARLDYEQARGYAHYQILEKARKQLQKALEQTRSTIKEQTQKVPALEAARQHELLQELEHRLLQTRLDEVPGIGQALKQRILTTLHARRLSDLHQAYTVSGVGENRQYEINQWIHQYTQRLPQLVNEPFPGRETIIKKYESQIAETKRALAEQQRRETTLVQRLATIEPHYTWLQTIDAQTFEKAALGVSDDTTAITRYTIGLFAEWEPIPEWFKAIMNEEIA